MKPFLQRSLANADVVPVVRGMSVVVILAMCATFLVSALMIHAVLSDGLAREGLIRQTRLARAHMMALQLDEETGIRGLGLTRSRIFIQPYRAARAAWPAANALLRNRLGATDPAAAYLADAENAENRRWLASIAEPIVRDPTAARSLQLELTGKRIVDRFRLLDAHLTDDLQSVTLAGDAAMARSIDRIVLWAVVLGITIVAVVIAFTGFLVRLLDEMRAQQQAYEEEKRIADMLQEAFIQKSLPEIAALSLDAVYIPAGEEAKVGGDWYDAFELPDKRILFSIGDVCGHGVQAAIVMSRARQAILSASMSNDDPAKVLALANDVLMLQESTMVTAVCGFIDPRSMTITYATAGHPPPILARTDGSVQTLPTSGPPLGVVHDPLYSGLEAQGSLDAMLVLYTDGLIEYGRNPIEGEERLLRVVAESAIVRAANPAQHIYQAIFDGAAPVDDVALLVASFSASANGASDFARQHAGRLWRTAADSANLFALLVPELRPVAILKSSGGVMGR